MLETICKVAILVMAAAFLITPFNLAVIKYVIFIAGCIVFLTRLPALGSSYKKPVYAFLALSIFLIIRYNLPFETMVDGMNSLVSAMVIIIIMQVFVIPLRLGHYDLALETYLKNKFSTQISLYLFIIFITHILGSFMLFGTIPMMYNIFSKPLKNLVDDYKYFTATAVSRGYGVVTLWAPGTVSIILVLQTTGVKWLQILPPAFILAFIAIITSILMEMKHLKGRPILNSTDSPAELAEGSNNEGFGKILTLLLVAVLLFIAVAIMEKFHVLTSSTRVLAAGLAIAAIWTLALRRETGLKAACQEYWDKSIMIVPDLAALFFTMGIFIEAVQQSGLMTLLQGYLSSAVNSLGPYFFIPIPFLVILLSILGLHPFVSILLIGQAIAITISDPTYQLLLALAILLGSVVSYMISPFAGNVLTLSKLVERSPGEVAFKWNGMFCITYLLEGIVFLLILQWLF